MTGDELRTLDDLLGKFRTAHAPMWIRPHVSALRRLARTLAGQETPPPPASVVTQLADDTAAYRETVARAYEAWEFPAVHHPDPDRR